MKNILLFGGNNTMNVPQNDGMMRLYMKRLYINKQAIAPLFTACVCLVLIGSFGVHSLQITHTHPTHAHISESTHSSGNETSVSINEYIHGNEQKMLLAILLSLLLFGLLHRPTFLHTSWKQLLAACAARIKLRIQDVRLIHSRASSYLQHMFSSGVIHPKLFS